MEEEAHELRPEEMVPYVREYLGLLRDKEVMEHEIKRCFSDYKKTREKLMTKKKPIDDRFGHVEEIIKKRKQFHRNQILKVCIHRAPQ